MTDDNPQAKVLTPQQVAVGVICKVCDWEPALMAGRAGRLWKALKALGATPDEIEAAYGRDDVGASWWWWRDDWRGKRGDWPQDYTIRETWKRRTTPIAVQLPAKRTGLDSLLEYAHAHADD